MVEFPYLAASGCQIDGVEQHEQALWVTAHSTTEVARCPACAGNSTSIHSYHVRVLKDLPVGEFSVTLKLRTKRFRCRNPDCAQSTFVETIPAVLVKHARRTPRLTSAIWHIGQVTGGQAGSRLAYRLQMPVSRATVLRILRQTPTCEREPPIIIGVDDWAKRKGQRYGTIVVDLENHRVVDLLDDRDSETLARWLRQYPALQVVARDRSMQSAQGISDGAPQAIQIADRWHLLKNLSEVVERVLQELLPRLKQRTTIHPSISAPRDNFPRAKPDQVRQAATRAQRLREYTLIQYLHRRGFGERRIARVLGMSRGKVSRYLDAETFPERKAHYVPSNLDPYLSYLEQRVQEGCTNAEQLWREIRDHGYPGGSSQVTKWMQNRRKKSQPLQGQSLTAIPVSLPDIRTCVRLLTASPARLSSQEVVLLDMLLRVDPLRMLYELAQGFAAMVRQRQAQALDAWLATCNQTEFSSLKHFAVSLQQDYAAVHTALDLPWSNGQTEGQVNRLKLLKRQMYGRANLDLLRLRMLYSP